ncbi:MAG: hypothetical protein ABL961_11940 [Vicinamibacterales bacterium]
MKPETMSMLPRLALFALATGASLTGAAAQDLPAKAEVRFQPAASSKLAPGWRTGTLYSSLGDCARVITADPTVRGGQRVLQLVGIQKLERRDGARWVEVPVQAQRAKEPRWCGEAVGG